MNNYRGNPRPQRSQGQSQGQPQGRQSQGSSGSYKGGINISFSTILLVVCFALVIANVKLFSSIIIKNDALQEGVKKTDTQVQESQPDPQKLIEDDINNNFITVTVNADDIKRGNLILVNSGHPYVFEASPAIVKNPEPITLPDSVDASYWVKSNYDTFSPEAHENIDRMLTDFALAQGSTDIMILDTYRTYDDQKNVQYSKIQQLGEAEGRKLAANPGESEHHTNLAVDLTLFDGANYSDYDGTGIYSWIGENCYKYGFIIRYPENKSDLTGIIYEPWHLRYVGLPHAEYISKGGICFEEYIELIKKYPIDSNRFEYVCSDGNTYVTYYCEIPEGGEIKVPKNADYTLSGTNDGGIIVTYKK